MHKASKHSLVVGGTRSIGRALVKILAEDGYADLARSVQSLLVPDRIFVFVDDNPRKHHTFSPGHHISVLPSQVLYERKPDHVVILAWNYGTV
jgi:NAD(P)-dependent dehydrogenase (short-subunit alcohol dehydrogenase family)